ncbi:MAG TPA: hypothetical protein PLL78_14665 [Fimbriimonadaceae bacterium]|nr:hypothetical protein [Fimbriimonadaceae bacterium]HRJ97916.1 hypothetical protein [Fimbriimonadaceae bacterium]
MNALSLLLAIATTSATISPVQSDYNVLAPERRVNIYNATHQRVEVRVAGSQPWDILPGYTGWIRLRTNASTVYVEARVGNQRATAFVPFQNNRANCSIRRNNNGTLRIMY